MREDKNCSETNFPMTLETIAVSRCDPLPGYARKSIVARILTFSLFAVGLEL